MIRVNIRPIAARSRPGPVDAAGEQRGQRVALGGDPLSLGQRLAHQPAPPQRQPARELRVVLDRLPDVTHREVRLARVLQRGDDQVAGVGVEVRRDLAVEVRGQPVADVGLDQPLVPVGGRGVGVEEVDRPPRTAPSRRTGRSPARGCGRAAARRARTPGSPSRPSRPCRARSAPAWRRRRAARTPTARRTRWRPGGRPRPGGSRRPRRPVPARSAAPAEADRPGIPTCAHATDRLEVSPRER